MPEEAAAKAAAPLSTPQAVGLKAPPPANAAETAAAKPAQASKNQGVLARLSPPSGAAEVQLAAMPSEEAAQAEWRRLQEQMPEILGGHQPLVTKVERDGKAFWRLRTGGFADSSEVTAFCAHIRAAGTACVATTQLTQ
jgi:cell division septation protein DedD